MNAKNTIIATLVVVFIILGIAATYSAGYKHAVANNAERAIEVQQAMASLGQVIQQQEAKQAELNRQKVLTERERINAIKTVDHQAERVKELERQLARIIMQESESIDAEGSDKNNTDGRYHIYDAAAIERVWNSASGNSLPESITSRTIQTRLPETTIRPGNAGAFCAGWRRLVCTNQNSCWFLPGMQNQLQHAMAAM